MNSILQHALHNEQACDYIAENPQFTDWVVTTAFYSAVHFVNNKIFPGAVPLNGKQIHCKNFAEYYSQIPKSIRVNLHRDTINLVWQVLPQIGPDYERLFDICHDARYKNYHVSQKQAERARAILLLIKKICYSVAPVKNP